MTVTLKIDGQEVTAQPGESLLEVARKNGAPVPSLCHHKHIAPYGACRVCLVEVTKGGRTKITTSCNYDVQDGIEVRTDSEEIRRNRKLVLELLLPMAPESKTLKGLAKANGLETARFDSNPPNGDRPDCVLCGLCTRVCNDVVGAHAITLTGRGDRKGVHVPYQERVSQDCIGCGACAAVCPTGAIEMEFVKVHVLRKRSASKRLCRYNLMGMMPGALCPNNYDCAICEVDQRFVEACRPHHPIFAARGLVKPAGWEEN